MSKRPKSWTLWPPRSPVCKPFALCKSGIEPALARLGLSVAVTTRQNKVTGKLCRKLIFRHLFDFKFIFETCVFDRAVRFDLGQNEGAAVLPETDHRAMAL